MKKNLQGIFHFFKCSGLISQWSHKGSQSPDTKSKLVSNNTLKYWNKQRIEETRNMELAVAFL